MAWVPFGGEETIMVPDMPVFDSHLIQCLLGGPLDPYRFHVISRGTVPDGGRIAFSTRGSVAPYSPYFRLSSL